MPAQTTDAAFVSFASPSVWYAMGNIRGGMGRDTYTVYRSGNTGKTWTAMQTFTGLPATGIAFAAANAGAGWIGQIPPTPGWVTWGRTGGSTSVETFYGGVPLGSTPLREYQLATYPPTFFSATTGVMPVVMQLQTPVTWLTTTHDGGAHWSTPVRVPGSVYTSTDPLHIWAAGGHRLWRTVDGGKHWYAAELPRGFAITAIDFLNPQLGWAIAKRAGHVWLVVTSDGGRRWAARR
ncbi:MAG: hypothetical protein M0Z66_02230 [Thermaerobacter sp.]|nr:hypothetical protein [Thermaerobacter sp.]